MSSAAARSLDRDAHALNLSRRASSATLAQPRDNRSTRRHARSGRNCQRGSGMATGVVFEGKTLDDAVRKGLEALGLARAEVSIAGMEEGSGGFPGSGARPYKVHIMPRPGGPPPEPMNEEDRG